MKKITPLQTITLALLSLLPLAACSTETDVKTQTANHIARPAFMVERTINSGSFGLQAWERMHERNAPATIYIEGDGSNFLSGVKEIAKIDNPTPENPVALHLASRDLSKNLGYLARPCQYMFEPAEKGCDTAYWNTKKYTPEVMLAYETALNDMAARDDITGFNLVGYGGGANIAAVLAATRDDVLTLRTVAGNVSPRFVTDYHSSTPLASNSVFATDFGSKLSSIPQHHFIGAADEQIPPGAYHSYRQAVGLSDCINYSVIQDADHNLGWVQIWPQLLTLMPQCTKIQSDSLPPLPPADEFPGDYYKGMGKGVKLSK